MKNYMGRSIAMMEKEKRNQKAELAFQERMKKFKENKREKEKDDGKQRVQFYEQKP